MVTPASSFEIWDADNHMYEAVDSYTRYLPKRYEDAIRFVDVNGRDKLEILGQGQRDDPEPHVRGDPDARARGPSTSAATTPRARACASWRSRSAAPRSSAVPTSGSSSWTSRASTGA